jgi:Na+(H+)/acetate symporter ActP
MTHIDVTSLAFYIMLLGLVLGSAGLGYGLVRFFVAKKKRKDILKQIRDLK